MNNTSIKHQQNMNIPVLINNIEHRSFLDKHPPALTWALAADGNKRPTENLSESEAEYQTNQWVSINGGIPKMNGL